MKLILKMTVLSLILSSSTAVFAHTIKLSPKETKSLTNHSPWVLNATCNIEGSVNHGKVLVSIVENKGKVNGKNLSKGQATSVNFSQNENISVSADPGATVNIINVGEEKVQADCYS